MLESILVITGGSYEVFKPTVKEMSPKVHCDSLASLQSCRPTRLCSDSASGWSETKRWHASYEGNKLPAQALQMFKDVNNGERRHSSDLVVMTGQQWVTQKERKQCFRKAVIRRNLMSVLHLLLHPQSFHSYHIYLFHPLLFSLCPVFSLADINQVSGMETLTLLVCHTCLHLRPFPLF